MEHPAHDRQRLAEPAQPLREAVTELDAVGLVLGLEPGATDAEDRPAAGDVVERRRHLGGERRFAERVGADHQADPDPLGGLGPGGQRQPALEDRAVGAPDDRIEVVPRPQRVEAEAIGASSGFEETRPVGVLVPAQGAKSDVGHPPSVVSIRRGHDGPEPGRPLAAGVRLGLGCRSVGGTWVERVEALERPQAIDPRRERWMRREQPGSTVAVARDRVAEPEVLRATVGASSVSWSFASDSSARSRPRGLRVNSTDVASARNSRSRLVDAWTSAENSGATTRSMAATMSRKSPTRMPIASAARAPSSSLDQKNAPCLQPSIDALQEAVGDERDEPDEDRHVQGIARVEVADVPELVSDDALQLLAVHRLDETAGHRHRRVLRIAAGRERVLAVVDDDEHVRHRDVRGQRELADDVDQDRVGLRIGRSRPGGLEDDPRAEAVRR